MSAVDTLLALVRAEEEWRARGWNPEWASIPCETRKIGRDTFVIHPNGRRERLTWWQRVFGYEPIPDYRVATSEPRGAA